MKKSLILLFIVLFQEVAIGQIKEISLGIAPYGHWGLKESKGKVNLFSHSYSTSKPAFHFGFGWRTGSSDALVDLFYAKEQLIDETGIFSIETSHIALYGYQGYSILQGKRVQIPIYIGIGVSYYSQPIPTKLFFDIGGRFRIRFYITNRVALYAGGYYLLGIGGNKDNEKIVKHSGLETGFMFNF